MLYEVILTIIKVIGLAVWLGIFTLLLSLVFVALKKIWEID